MARTKKGKLSNSSGKKGTGIPRSGNLMKPSGDRTLSSQGTSSLIRHGRSSTCSTMVRYGVVEASTGPISYSAQRRLTTLPLLMNSRVGSSIRVAGRPGRGRATGIESTRRLACKLKTELWQMICSHSAVLTVHAFIRRHPPMVP